MANNTDISGKGFDTSDDDACKDDQGCGNWGKSWGPSSPRKSLHAIHRSSTSTPIQASPSRNNFSTHEPMRAARDTRSSHSGAFNPQDSKAALEEEIEDVGILGEGAPSPPNSDLGRLPQLRRRKDNMGATKQPPQGPLPQSTTVESTQR